MADLEQRLRALAGEAFPPAPDVREAVGTRIDAQAEPGRRGFPAPSSRSGTAGAHGAPRRLTARRRTLALGVGILLLPTAAIAAVPDTRQAVLEWLGLAHVRVERVPRVAPLPALSVADLGERVATPGAAARRAGFAPLVPSALGAPDATYVSEGDVVSLAYEPRPGLARDPGSGLGLLVTELRARGLRAYVGKAAGPGTRVERADVGRSYGIFVSGAPHEVVIRQPDGAIRPLAPRLAGNTLVFERGVLVVRLEGAFDRRTALAIARSLR